VSGFSPQISPGTAVTSSCLPCGRFDEQGRAPRAHRESAGAFQTSLRVAVESHHGAALGAGVDDHAALRTRSAGARPNPSSPDRRPVGVPELLAFEVECQNAALAKEDVNSFAVSGRRAEA